MIKLDQSGDLKSSSNYLIEEEESVKAENDEEEEEEVITGIYLEGELVEDEDEVAVIKVEALDEVKDEDVVTEEGLEEILDSIDTGDVEVIQEEEILPEELMMVEDEKEQTEAVNETETEPEVFQQKLPIISVTVEKPRTMTIMGKEVVLRRLPVKNVPEPAINVQKHSPTRKTVVFATPQEREAHEENVRKMNEFFTFACPNCNILTFDSYLGFRKHMLAIHGEKKPAIYCCTRKLNSQSTLLDHMQYHLNSDELKCHLCGFLEKNSNRLKAHLRQHQERKIIANTRTKRVWPSSMTPEQLAKYEEDTNKMNNFYTFQCHVCNNVTMDTYDKFTKHMKSVHGEKKPVIICCKKRFYIRSALVDHMRYHLEPEQMKCPHCDTICKDSYQYKSHILRHLNPSEVKIHVCDVCGKSFSYSHALKVHLQSHLPSYEREKLKKYFCSQCDKGFNLKSVLDHHIRLIHEKKYECVCDVCAQSFKNQTALNYHYTHHHTNPPKNAFECDECGAKFRFKDTLKHHIKRQHVNPGPHYCDFCGKEFQNYSGKKSHIKLVHLAERTLQCSMCDKAFKTAKILEEHEAGHRGIPLYSCEFCDRTFMSNANMYTHRRKMHSKQVEEAKRLAKLREEQEDD